MRFRQAPPAALGRRRRSALVALLMIALVPGAAIITPGAASADTPGPASATRCDAGGSHKGRTGVTCLYVNGSGVRVNYTDTYHWEHTPVNVCSYRAWNQWEASVNNFRSRTSSTVHRCVREAHVRLNYSVYVVNPSYFKAQFYHNGTWVGDHPRVLITT